MSPAPRPAPRQRSVTRALLRSSASASARDGARASWRTVLASSWARLWVARRVCQRRSAARDPRHGTPGSSAPRRWRCPHGPPARGERLPPSEGRAHRHWARQGTLPVEELSGVGVGVPARPMRAAEALARAASSGSGGGVPATRGRVHPRARNRRPGLAHHGGKPAPAPLTAPPLRGRPSGRPASTGRAVRSDLGARLTRWTAAPAPLGRRPAPWPAATPVAALEVSAADLHHRSQRVGLPAQSTSWHREQPPGRSQG